MNNILLAILALSLAACSQSAEQRQPVANNADAAETNTVAEAPAHSLEGEWVVEKTNATAPDQIWPMTAEATKDQLTIVSECRKMRWTYKQDRKFIRFTPAAGVECKRVRSPAELIANSTMKLANTAFFSEDGRTVDISGPGGTISMTRR